MEAHVMGRFHAGEELQEEERFAKADLNFPSGEPLPRCWLDPAYQLHQKSTCAQSSSRDQRHSMIEKSKKIG